MRKFTGAFVVAALMAGVFGAAQPAFADTGSLGGAAKSTCGFLAGLLYKVGAPEVIGAILSNIFEC
jgi:hypothetical protein